MVLGLSEIYPDDGSDFTLEERVQDAEWGCLRFLPRDEACGSHLVCFEASSTSFMGTDFSWLSRLDGGRRSVYRGGMNRLRGPLAGCALFLLACHAHVSPATDSPGAAAASPAVSWSRFAEALTASWETDGSSGRIVRVSYELTSRGSTLLETWQRGTPAETITVYHPDGDQLLLTHYCGQGNQARLRAVTSSENRVHFRRFDATNLDSEQSVLDELVLEVNGERLVRVETYASASGERETTELVFHRSPPSLAPSEVADPRTLP